MPRDPGLEELIHSALGENFPGLAEKTLFGGWAFMLFGNLLCGARRGSLMLRVGQQNEPAALKLPGVTPVVMQNRHMKGYVRATPEAYADPATLQQLLEAAIAFTLSLPKK
jgi:TfoX/Sxy family transcriptional regulator of competence genes